MNRAAQVDHTPPTESVVTVGLPARYLVVRHWLACLTIIISLPILFPLAIIVSLFIKLDSRGSVIFKQERVGRHGRTFTMYKFRTMKEDTHVAFALTERNDSRITGVGRVLQETHLDELPQIWNILRGEMDLIGPRPVPLQLYAFYQEAIRDYDIRHLVRPGITGLAQLELGYTRTLEGEIRKWERDLQYLTNISITKDSYILAQTVHLFCSCVATRQHAGTHSKAYLSDTSSGRCHDGVKTRPPNT